MSDPVSALGHVVFDGFAQVREIGPSGMISLRAKPDLPGLAAAVRAVSGTDLPLLRRIILNGDWAVGWMSPDEVLLILPYAQVTEALVGLAVALQGQHHLAVDVSDARAVFRIRGEKADQVLRKLSPVDFDSLATGELRRTRLAQVAAAFWRDCDGFTLVCFRSVAAYTMELLTQATQLGRELR